MLENFENFESNVLDRIQVGLTWLFHDQRCHRCCGECSYCSQTRCFRTSEKHRSTDNCRRHQVTPRLKLVDGNILKLVSRYIDFCVTNIITIIIHCSARSESRCRCSITFVGSLMWVAASETRERESITAVWMCFMLRSVKMFNKGI